MKIHKLVLIIPAALLLASCTKQPTACMDVEERTYGVGEKIPLVASCSQDAYEYQWTFLYNGSSDSSVDDVWGEDVKHIGMKVADVEVKLNARSKNNKKRDEITGNFNLVDTCHVCISGDDSDTLYYYTKNYLDYSYLDLEMEALKLMDDAIDCKMKTW